MAFANARIIEAAGYSTVVMDRPTTNLLYYYSGLSSKASDAWTELALVCSSRSKAEEVLASDNEIGVGHNFSSRRGRSFPGAAGALKGRAVLYDRYGAFDDDAGIKRTHRPPEGIEVRFRWDGSEQMYRMDAYTEKNGLLVTRTVVLGGGPKEFAADVEKAYARFVRTSPAPKGPRGIRCGTHVADIIRRLEVPASNQLKAWVKTLEATPLHERATVPELILPGWPLDRTIQSVTLRGTRGRDEIDASISYKEGNSVGSACVSIQAELPETVKASLTGQGADRLWGASELSGLRIGRHVQSRDIAGKAPIHTYETTVEMVPMPPPGNIAADEAKALATLRKNYASYTFDKVLETTFGAMPPSWTLHVLRELRVDHRHSVDLGYIPGVEAVRIRMNMQNKHVSIEESATARFGTLWPEEKMAEAA